MSKSSCGLEGKVNWAISWCVVRVFKRTEDGEVEGDRVNAVQPA